MEHFFLFMHVLPEFLDVPSSSNNKQYQKFSVPVLTQLFPVLTNRVHAANVIVVASGHVRNLPTPHFVQIVQLGVLGHQELSAKTSCQHDTSFNNLNRTMKLAASVEGETQKGPNFVPSSSFLGINSVVLPVVLQCFTL